MKIKFAVLAAALVSLSSVTNGQVTNTNIQIGGPLSLGSFGFDNPGRLIDGVTTAEAVYDLTLDVGAATLELTVINTSPITPGVFNPILYRIYFNAPEAANPGDVGVTGMTLASTTWPAGSPATPTFSLHFDGDSSDGFNYYHRADGFGFFNVALRSHGLYSGGISNPLADKVLFSALHGHGPTFLFNLTGNLTGLTADDFADILSHPPPGERNQNAVGLFKAGGHYLAFGFISNDNPRLYVELDFFRGSPIGGGLLLGWRTLAEVENVGFNIYRQPVASGANGDFTSEAVKLTTSLIPAQGDPFSGATYTFTTRLAKRPSVYWLEDIDIHGASTWHGPIRVGPPK